MVSLLRTYWKARCESRAFSVFSNVCLSNSSGVIFVIVELSIESRIVADYTDMRGF